MPSKNRAYILPRSIGSIQKQTFKDWELLVIDDGSTDNTKELILQYQSKDARIKYFSDINRLGPAGARNIGLEKSTGEFIAFLESDDEWLLNSFLEDSITALEKSQFNICLSLFSREKDGVVTNLYKKSADKLIEGLKPFSKDGIFYFENKRFAEFIILNWLIFYHLSGTIIRRNVISEIGLFNESLRQADDTEFVFRILTNYDSVCFINKYCFIWHQSVDSLLNFDTNKISEKEARQRIITHKSYEIKMLEAMREDMLGSEYVAKKRACDIIISRRKGELYYELSWLYRKNTDIRALKYAAISLMFGLNLLKVKYILSLVKSLTFRKPGRI
jgi:glycosyltransferase involved in cell wall biosynthesis